MVRQVVVQVGEGNFILCPDRLPDDDLVDVIELIPVLIPMEEIERDQHQHITSIITCCVMRGRVRLIFKHMKYASPQQHENDMVYHFFFCSCELAGNRKHKICWSILFLKAGGPYWRLMSRTRGSNFGPPGIAIFKALEVKKALRSNR